MSTGPLGRFRRLSEEKMLDSAKEAASGGRIRVTIVGFEPFWMAVLVDALTKRYSDEIECDWLLWPSTFAERLRFLRAALTSRVIVRLGMPFEFDSETNRLWLVLLRLVPRLRGVNYWMGSDVVLYRQWLADGHSGARERLAIARMRHFAGSSELAGELAEMGIPACTVVLPSPEREVPEVPPAFPDCFRVLAYIPDSRFEFYGGTELLAAARAMPDVEFDVMGGSGEGVVDVPGNVRYVGRVDAVGEFYERGVVLVRTVGHDSVPSGVVEEALLSGRHVVYSCRWPHTEYVPLGDTGALIEVLSRLSRDFSAGMLPMNLEGRAFTIEDWDPDRRAADLRAALIDVAED